MLMRQPDPAIGVTELVGFRDELYTCLAGWGDALFELTDAMLCAPGPITSVAHLSLECCFRRSHGSLYRALADGQVDADGLRDVLVAHRPDGWPAIFAVDASTWERCDAETSPQRGFYYHPSKHSAGQPIVAGWSYQWISQLDWAPDSWTAPVDARRIPPTVDGTDATVDQVRQLVDLLGDHGSGQLPMFVFDAGYDPIALGYELADTRAQVLVRIRNDRVFYGDPPQRATGTIGRPRRHGHRFALADPATWHQPDDEHVADHARYGTVTVRAWHGLHPKLGRHRHWADHKTAPIVRGTIIRVEVEHLPKPTARSTKTLWLWWSGSDVPDLDVCFRAYLRRFDLEHTYRFVKTTLGWTTPRVRTPEQADRWTWLLIAAYTQLRLARGLVADHRLPWERPREPAQLTPARVRRGFGRLAHTLGTPASPPKSDVAGPGRPKGSCAPPRTRYPVIKKTT